MVHTNQNMLCHIPWACNLRTPTLPSAQALVTSPEDLHPHSLFHSLPFQYASLSVHCFLPSSLQPTYVNDIKFYIQACNLLAKMEAVSEDTQL